MSKHEKGPPYQPVGLKLSFLSRRLVSDNPVEWHVGPVRSRLNFGAYIARWWLTLDPPIGRIKANIHIAMLSIAKLFPFLQTQ